MNPVTILQVGNQRHPWCSEVHFAASLELLGHRVVRYQEEPRMNWAPVVEQVERSGAQLLLWTRTWDTDKRSCDAAMARLKELGIPTVSYHLDRYWGLDREYLVHSEPFFQATQILFSPDAAEDRWAEAGVNHVWMPPGVFGPECEPVKPDPRLFPEPVVFVGSHPYPHPAWEPYRTAAIDAMREHFGPRFKVWPVNRRPLRNNHLTCLYQTAQVVVGDSCVPPGPDGKRPDRYWSDRIPETIGRGGFLVHPDIDFGGRERELPMYVGGEHLATYPLGDFDALVETVEYYLNNPEEREVIRKRGQALVLERDTYQHRMARMLEVVADTLGIPEPRPKPKAPPAMHYARLVGNQRVQATFRLVDGDSDRIGVDEVWKSDDYHLLAHRAEIRGKTVVDIGANVGAFSVLAAKLGAGRVLAFEPHPDNFAALAENVATNGVGPLVTMSPCAVLGPDRPPGPAYMSGSAGGAFVGFVPDYGKDPRMWVDVVDVNEMLAAAGDVEFCKVDVEGSELGIIAGLLHDALDRIHYLSMEWHGPGMPHLTHLDDDGRFLERWGAMVAKLADHGRVETFGHPRNGGLLWWKRYS